MEASGRRDSARPRRRFERGSDEFTRVLAFSDAPFAIAMTLLVVGIEVPDLSETESVGDLADALYDDLGSFISFLISFLVIGRYWAAHHGGQGLALAGDLLRALDPARVREHHARGRLLAPRDPLPSGRGTQQAGARGRLPIAGGAHSDSKQSAFASLSGHESDRFEVRAESRAQVADHLLGMLGDLLPGVTADLVPGAAQYEFAPAVTLRRRRVGVRLVSVELDDHPLSAPERVDLEPPRA